MRASILAADRLHQTLSESPSTTTSGSTSDRYREAVEVSALTDIGMRRRNNQDSLAYHLADGRAAWERSGHLFVVADGMGAHAAGELASRLAVDLVQHHYEKNLQPHPVENLHRALIEANNEIHRRGQANIEFRNMGTTCSALILVPKVPSVLTSVIVAFIDFVIRLWSSLPSTIHSSGKCKPPAGWTIMRPNNWRSRRT